jgi:hypothetical protein
MATVESRYKAATDYVRRAIAAVANAPSSWNLIDRYAASIKTEPVRDELSHIESRWLRSTGDFDRAKVARDAELLADRTKENLPGAPTDWKRTNFYRGEQEKTTPATSYGGEVVREIESGWKSDAHESGGIPTWLLVAGACALVITGVLVGKRRQASSTARVLNRELERVAAEREDDQ